MTDVNSCWEMITTAWEPINIYEGPQTFLASIANLPKHVVLLYASSFCTSEICNGGFLQFFNNSTGILEPEAAAGYREIGMSELASVVDEASALLGEPYPRERTQRQQALVTASNLSDAELKTFLEDRRDRFAALRRATRSLNLDSYDHRFYALVESESGGFEAAADRYALQF